MTHCGTARCSAGNVSTTVDDPATYVGQWTSIAIGRDALPIVGHLDITLTSLRVTHCNNVTCTSGVSTPVDNTAGSGYMPSMTIGTDGLPVIAQYDAVARGLRVTHCGDAS